MAKRKIPDWLAEIVPLNNKENENANSENAIILQNNNEKSENINQRILRSMSTKTKSPPKKQSDFPYIDYKGEIKYITDWFDVAIACENFLQSLGNNDKAIIPVAFDMEWPFSFVTGPGKTAVIQLCFDVKSCCLFHVSKFKKLPASFVSLLNNPKVRLHGVNIKNDLRKLERDFPEVKAQKMIDQCIDLGTWCNNIHNTGGRWSLERLVLHICKLRINKNKKVRMSKWNVIPLSHDQKLYAAIDVYISQIIYEKLENQSIEKERCTKEFRDKYGDKAYAAVNSLDVDFIDLK